MCIKINSSGSFIPNIDKHSAHKTNKVAEASVKQHTEKAPTEHHKDKNSTKSVESHKDSPVSNKVSFKPKNNKPEYSLPPVAPKGTFPIPDNKLKGHVVGTAKGTAYIPKHQGPEGGPIDRSDAMLRTLQDFTEGRSGYVSIAIDKNLYTNKEIKYGDRFHIKEVDEKYKDVLKNMNPPREHIEFLAVDTGGDFVGTGYKRIDICVRPSDANPNGDKTNNMHEPTINGNLTLEKMPRDARLLPEKVQK